MSQQEAAARARAAEARRRRRLRRDGRGRGAAVVEAGVVEAELRALGDAPPRHERERREQLAPRGARNPRSDSEKWGGGGARTADRFDKVEGACIA